MLDQGLWESGVQLFARLTTFFPGLYLSNELLAPFGPTVWLPATATSIATPLFNTDKFPGFPNFPYGFPVEPDSP